MGNQAGEMHIFLRWWRQGTFPRRRAAADDALTVSKLVGRIGAWLGVRLFERSICHLSLTDEDQIYHEKSQVMLDKLDEIEQELAQSDTSTGGTIRVNTSHSGPEAPAAWVLEDPPKYRRRSLASRWEGSIFVSTAPTSPSA